jgi:glycosyltransferase involved in cell wall biosynthesis
MDLLKVIIAHHFYEGSAASNRVLAYARGFAELGFDVVMILGVESDVNIPAIPNIRIQKCICKHWKQSKLMAQKIKKEYIEHQCFILVYGTPTLCWYLPKKKYTIFYECTEIPFYGRKKTLSSKIKETIKNYLSHRATGMLVISKALENHFKNCGIENITVINMFVDSTRFENIKTEISTKYIAYCGWVSEYKDGVDCLIKAFSIFQETHNDYKLYIVGSFISPNDEKKLRELVSLLNLTDSVIFTGRIGASDMPRILCGAKMLALARPDNEQSKYGFPTKLGEYLATGKPVVVTDVGEIGLFLKDKINCRLCKPGDVHDFTEKMKWVAENYEEALEIGRMGQKLVKAEFSCVEQCKSVLSFYNKLKVNQ